MGDLETWSQSLGAPLDYVDNCWVRLPATGRMLQKLLRAKLTSEVPLERLRVLLHPDATYVLVAEEF